MSSNEELTVTLKEYIDLSGQIKETKMELKIVQERAKELEESIMEFMKKNSIDTLKTQGGSIKLYNTKSKAPLNEDYLRDALSQKIDTVNIDKVIEAAFSSRPITESQKIKLNLVKGGGA